MTIPIHHQRSTKKKKPPELVTPTWVYDRFFFVSLEKIQNITERSVFFTTIPTGLTHAEEKKKRKVSALEESMETSAQQPGAQAPFSGGQRGFLPIDGDERAHYHTS